MARGRVQLPNKMTFATLSAERLSSCYSPTDLGIWLTCRSILNANGPILVMGRMQLLLFKEHDADNKRRLKPAALYDYQEHGGAIAAMWCIISL